MEQEVEIVSGDLTLSGSLTLPDAPKAIVVFAHGSGPLDRDENSPGGQLNVFNALAADLAAAGIASLRFDKRGIGASGGDYALAGQSDFVDDLRAVAQFAARKCDAPLFLCGHSEGTYIAPQVIDAAGAGGMILVCAYAQTGQEVLISQAARADLIFREMSGVKGWLSRRILDVTGSPSKKQRALIQKVLGTDTPTIRHARQNVPVTWLRDFIKSDPAQVHQSYSIPTLILTAEHDAQCEPGDGAVIAALGPNRTNVILTSLSHILRQTDRRDVMDYPRQIESPIDPLVGRSIVAWIDEQLLPM